ncbi:SDR family oxidoreductase [Sphingomonas sp. JC676]|uniref:SDR family oxidoreductase n=1 Tax=Sphingomonas sp. JC676 TaxID=2768065 RepID=UPI001658365D|nr:SDR family oxidoreductase [Sphingomonas sp. JC676]MBC9033504.1 SDR family oxidoreductase [Sphingomonas sp. JC676]
MSNPTILITGTSSGLGQKTALHFAEQGWNVAATMRTPERDTMLRGHDRIAVIPLDVTDVDSVRAGVAAAIERFGRIDVVVNNAGVGAYGPLELAEEATIDWQFAVNVRGPINVIRAMLPHFRANRAGTFVNVSSYMGLTSAVPTGSLYNMSKFALEGLTEGLSYELRPFGIRLRLIESGGFKGNSFLDNMVFSRAGDGGDYAAVITNVERRFAEVDETRLDDAQTIVDAIHAAATREDARFRTVIGADGNALMAMRNSMPIEDYLDTIAAQFGL